MNNFHLPNVGSFLEQFQNQLKSISYSYKALSILVGAVFPIFEGIIINRATDSSNPNTGWFWLLLTIVAIIHIICFVITLLTEAPLPQFLIEFNNLKQELKMCYEYQDGLEAYNKIFLSANKATELSLIGIERIIQGNISDPVDISKIILDSWIKGRSDIFLFENGNAMYNFAIYLINPSNKDELICVFRDHDNRIEPKNRSWTKGVGHVGICWSREETQFSKDTTQDITTTNRKKFRQEDSVYYKSLIAEPIQREGQISGVLVLTSSEPEQFDQEVHTQCVRVMARLLALALNRW